LKKVIIENITKENIIAENGNITTSFYDRFKGLLGRKEIKHDEALIIIPCNSIHMFFMKFPIDVIFIDKNDRVCEIIQNIEPWRVSKIIKEAKYVIELKTGKIEKVNIEIGDLICYN